MGVDLFINTANGARIAFETVISKHISYQDVSIVSVFNWYLI